MIEKEFSHLFKFAFYDADYAHSKNFGATVRYCDAVCCMTHFSSHSADTVLKNAGVKFLRIVGGMSTLRAKLTSLAQEIKHEPTQIVSSG